MTALKAGEVGFGTPFAAAIEHLRRKLTLPTERWDDIMRAAHDRAFIVAGASKADLLHDLQQAVIAAGEGEGQAGFRQRFKAIVARHGWTGWTGEGSAAGTAWRTRVIYQTNMATSYAAGRWRQLTDPAVAELLPWFVYRHADGVLHPRPLHQAWDGLTLRQGHPFWRTHWAPNGWGCHCKVFAVAQPAPGARTEPPAGWDAIDPATGEPVGIDRGFGHAPGANALTPLQRLIDDKLLRLDAPIGAAMWQHLRPALAMERQQQWWDTLDAWLADTRPQGRQATVGTLTPPLLEQMAALGVDLPSSAEITVSDRIVLGAKARRHDQAGNGLLAAEWRQLTALLDAPAAVYLDTASGNLIFVAEGSGPVKAVVRYSQAERRVVTAFRVSAADVAGAVKGGQWQPLET